MNSTSDEIVEGTFQALEGAGYIVEPRTVDLFIRIVDNIKDLGFGFKVSGNLSLEGGGVPAPQSST